MSHCVKTRSIISKDKQKSKEKFWWFQKKVVPLHPHLKKTSVSGV